MSTNKSRLEEYNTEQHFKINHANFNKTSQKTSESKKIYLSSMNLYILHEIARNSNLIMKGEFFDKTSVFNNVSFLKQLLHVEHNISKQLKIKTKLFITFSLA